MILAEHYFKGDFKQYMLYFIPAWYQQNKWSEHEQIWYERRMHTEFDDTVKQIQLFHRNKVYPYQILLLSFPRIFAIFFTGRESITHLTGPVLTRCRRSAGKKPCLCLFIT